MSNWTLARDISKLHGGLEFRKKADAERSAARHRRSGFKVRMTYRSKEKKYPYRVFVY